MKGGSGMKKTHTLVWLIPLIVLLLLIPFLVPSALQDAGAEVRGLVIYRWGPPPDPDLVAQEPVRQGFVDVEYEIEPFLPGLKKDHVAQVVEQRAQLVRSLREIHLSGLYL